MKYSVLFLLVLASCASKPTLAPEVAVVTEAATREPAGLSKALEKFRELVEANPANREAFQKLTDNFNKALPKLGEASFGGMHSTVFAQGSDLVVRVFRHKASPVPKGDFKQYVDQALHEANIDAQDFNIKPSMRESWIRVGSKSETIDMVSMKISISKISEHQLKTLLRRLSSLNEGAVSEAF